MASRLPGHLIPSDLRKGYTGPTSHVPSDLGRDVNNPAECEYEPPAGHLIELDITGTYTPPAGHLIEFDFRCEEPLPPRPIPTFNWYNFEGSTLSNELRIEVIFTNNGFHTGESIYFNLDTRPQWNPTFRIYEGATLGQLALNYDPALAPNIWEGATLRSVLTTYPSAKLEPNLFEGSTAQIEVSVTAHLVIDWADGAWMEPGFDTAPVETLVATFSEGSTLVGELNASTIFTAPFFEGAVFEADVNTSPAAELAIVLSEGATIVTDLGLAFVAMSWRGWEGATLLPALADNPAAPLAVNFYAGATLVPAVSFATQFNPAPWYEGSVLSLVIGNAENWIFWEGSTLDASFSTVTAIPADFFEGSSTRFELATRPSEGIGVISVWEGARADVVVVDSRSKTFGSLMRNSCVIQIDMDTSTNFDLGRTCNYEAPPAWDHVIDVALNEPAGWRNDGDRICFDVVLSAAPRIGVDFFEGATCVVRDPIDLSFTFHEGAEIVDYRLAEEDLHLRLCRGNFLPDGDFIDVELSAPYGTCYADFQYTGETMTASLATVSGLALDMREGAALAHNLTIPDSWVILMREGAFLRVMNPDVYVRPWQQGETLHARMPDMVIDMYTGESLSQLNLRTEYDVRFLEEGCLNNNYQYIDEFGDPIKELYRSVPIEGYPYLRDILGECF